MQEIISVQKTVISGSEENSVNSRDIYEYLEVGTDYNTWIKRAIDKYDFVENDDFMLLKNGEQKQGGHNKVDYIVTMDMAKELCMVSNTEKGKATRKYFIAIEKKATEPMTLTEQLIKSAIALDEQAKRISYLELKMASNNDKLLEDVTDLIEINTIRETKPLPGYHAVGFYQGRYGMSYNKIKEMAVVFGPKACRCSKNIEGLVSEYYAYHITDMDDAFNNVKTSSVKVSKTRHTSPYLKGKFEIN